MQEGPREKAGPADALLGAPKDYCCFKCGPIRLQRDHSGLKKQKTSGDSGLYGNTQFHKEALLARHLMMMTVLLMTVMMMMTMMMVFPRKTDKW